MPGTEDFLMIDLPAILVAVLAALACALPGNFLVLRRQALMGDAMSHVVLPGIVAAYALTGDIAPLPMVLGALVAALVAVALIGGLQRVGGLEPGAAMGVVFTAMFAAGLVWLEQSGAGNAHLDVEHALYGNLEGTLWLGPASWGDLLRAESYRTLPTNLITLAGVTLAMLLLLGLFFKELAVTTFDPGLATGLGISERRVGLGLMAMVAVAAVAAFEAVGSIIVIAMFVCPPATARMLTDRLATQIWLSALFAALAGAGGYWLAAHLPLLLGSPNSLNAAGMVAVAAGAMQCLAMLLAPRYGVVVRAWRNGQGVTAS
ncbi:MAG: metal ABC transporter permease [Zoogloeaceae bacterium]|nr:metal ABC transporter permease [Zoogloeaceae bacterium]